MRPGGERPRSAVTFAASEFWKGERAKKITLHVVAYAPDCIGARFDAGKEYVVFAHTEEVDDHLLGRDFWYGWSDVLPKGSKLFTVNSACNSTAEIKQAAKTLKNLGKGKKPRLTDR
jgi:hypothetical protein